ncbi:hypothetical protein ACTU6V_01415 [Microbacterium sp. A204]|uniref:hypothetical protein n=1 Tax=Microbacterium sp. A204 TaxID=3457321 RepID=UPI003FD1DECA
MGHDHTYARGYVNTDATETPGITSGPVYVVSNSGAKHYDLETDAKNVWTNNGATQVLRGAGVTKYDDGQKWVTEAGITPPAQPEPEVPASLVLGAESVVAGGKVAVSGADFAPGAEIVFELRSTPVRIGSATVAADGSFTASLTIPAETPAGAHTLAAILPDGTEVTAALTVTAAASDVGPGAGDDGTTGSGGSASGDIATTGADSTALIAGAVLLLAMGLGLFAMRRRMRAE